MASRSDLVLRAVRDEVERRRAGLDAADGLTGLSVFVHLDKRTGRPRQVVSRAETSRDVECGRRPSALPADRRSGPDGIAG